MSNINVEEIFGENVFTVGKMRERLPKKVFANLMNVMNKGGELSISDADVIAKAMKDWAVERVQHTIPTGSSHSQVSQLRSTMPSSHILMQTAR